MNEQRSPESPEYRASQYVDGAFDDVSREAFERQMAVDPSLADVVASYRAIDAVSRSVSAMPEFDAGAMSAAFSTTRLRADVRGRRWMWAKRVATSMSAAAAVVFASVALLEKPARIADGGVFVEWSVPGSAPVSHRIDVSYDRQAVTGDMTGMALAERPRVIAIATVGREVHWPTGEGWPGGGREW